MIDFALEAERKEGKGPVEAIHESCIVRFRPIMMNNMAALMGRLPIALIFGAGTESRRPRVWRSPADCSFPNSCPLFSMFIWTNSNPFYRDGSKDEVKDFDCF